MSNSEGAKGFNRLIGALLAPKDKSVNLRISKEMLDYAKKKAQSNELTLSAYISYLIVKDYKCDDCNKIQLNLSLVSVTHTPTHKAFQFNLTL